MQIVIIVTVLATCYKCNIICKMMQLDLNFKNHAAYACTILENHAYYAGIAY